MESIIGPEWEIKSAFGGGLLGGFWGGGGVFEGGGGEEEVLGEGGGGERGGELLVGREVGRGRFVVGGWELRIGN